MGLFSLFKKRNLENNIDSVLLAKYKLLLDYFKEERFGANLPVLTMFSYLPLTDRINTLKILLQTDLENPYIYDKLSLALLKNNKKNDALALLKDAKQNKRIDNNTYLILVDKIKSLAITFEAENSDRGQDELASLGISKPKTVFTYNEIPSEISPFISQSPKFYIVVCSFCKQQN